MCVLQNEKEMSDVATYILLVLHLEGYKILQLYDNDPKRFYRGIIKSSHKADDCRISPVTQYPCAT